MLVTLFPPSPSAGPILDRTESKRQRAEQNARRGKSWFSTQTQTFRRMLVLLAGYPGLVCGFPESGRAGSYS